MMSAKTWASKKRVLEQGDRPDNAQNKRLVTGDHAPNGDQAKKRIILNAFDMFTPSHLSFGQWRRPEDRASTKRRDLSYWTNLAQILERGDITMLFLADTYGQHDVYQGSAEATIRTACQFPMGDPAVPVTAMAAVTKKLGFAITTSTSYESPFVLAKRFSTLDHLTKGRFGWNIVTGFKPSAAKAVGLPYLEHDKRYEIASEYLEVLYKIWEGSWADNALKEDVEREIYADYSRIRVIHHDGEHFKVDAPHILDPSPQRTPLLLQAGTSSAGIAFAAKHAEVTLVVAPSPHILKPQVAKIRAAAAAAGRDPRSIKVLAVMTPILGATDDEAQAKYRRALEFASFEAGLVFYSANAGIDLSQFDPDKPITPGDAAIDGRVHSLINTLSYQGADVPEWTPRNIGKLVSIGGNGPVPVGSPARVAEVMEEWIEIADLDGFNIGSVVVPGSFEDLVDLLVPELRRRGRYPIQEVSEGNLTLRERIYEAGQARLREDHYGSTWKYDKYPAKA